MGSVCARHACCGTVRFQGGALGLDEYCCVMILAFNVIMLSELVISCTACTCRAGADIISNVLAEHAALPGLVWRLGLLLSNSSCVAEPPLFCV